MKHFNKNNSGKHIIHNRSVQFASKRAALKLYMQIIP